MVPTLIRRLTFLTDVVPQLFTQLERDLIYQHPAPGKWSPIEILGHLCDSALHNWKRFGEITCMKGPYKVVSYPQDALVQSNHYQKAGAGDVLQLWVGLNRQIIFLWTNYLPTQLALPVILPDGSPANLQFIIKDYVEHLEHHLKQIFTTTLDVDVPETVADNAFNGKDELLKVLFRKGNISVECYKPVGTDNQKPHLQDEFYFIVKGRAIFNRNGSETEVNAGEFLFVPAGMPHHFLNFSTDFTTWVVFF